MSKYREQYERTKRMYDRFRRTSSQEVGVEFSGESLKDDGLVFFQSCLHLRDWIEKDEKLPQAVREAGRPYVTANRALSLCRDIAIAAKHVEIRKRLAPDARPELRPSRTVEQRPAVAFYDDDDDNYINSLPPETPIQVVLVRLVMDRDGGEAVDALTLANECVEAWDAFFKQYGLT